MASIIKQRLRRFNGTDYDSIYLSANVDDVVGTLPVANGGTGNSSADTTPTSNSTKMCTSGGIYTALGNKASASALTNHTGNVDIHVTAAQKTAWNGKVDASALTAHTSDSDIHVTAAQKTTWNNKVDTSALTAHTGDNTIHVTSSEKSTWNGKQNALTFDITPTSGSANPVTSGGIYTALAGSDKGIPLGGVVPSMTELGDKYIQLNSNSKTILPANNDLGSILREDIASKVLFTNSNNRIGAYNLIRGTFDSVTKCFVFFASTDSGVHMITVDAITLNVLYAYDLPAIKYNDYTWMSAGNGNIVLYNCSLGSTNKVITYKMRLSIDHGATWTDEISVTAPGTASYYKRGSLNLVYDASVGTFVMYSTAYTTGNSTSATVYRYKLSLTAHTFSSAGSITFTNDGMSDQYYLSNVAFSIAQQTPKSSSVIVCASFYSSYDENYRYRTKAIVARSATALTAVAEKTGSVNDFECTLWDYKNNCRYLGIWDNIVYKFTNDSYLPNATTVPSGSGTVIAFYDDILTYHGLLFNNSLEVVDRSQYEHDVFKYMLPYFTDSASYKNVSFIGELNGVLAFLAGDNTMSTYGYGLHCPYFAPSNDGLYIATTWYLKVNN